MCLKYKNKKITEGRTPGDTKNRKETFRQISFIHHAFKKKRMYKWFGFFFFF